MYLFVGGRRPGTCLHMCGGRRWVGGGRGSEGSNAQGFRRDSWSRVFDVLFFCWWVGRLGWSDNAKPGRMRTSGGPGMQGP